MPISFKSLTSSGPTQREVIIRSTQAWVAPADVSNIELILVAGGGGGAGKQDGNENCFGGAGSAQYRRFLTVTPNQSYTVTIGGGGNGGFDPEGAGGGGTAGSASSFGALVTAPGGNPGFVGGYASGGISRTRGQGVGGSTITSGTYGGSTTLNGVWTLPASGGIEGLAGAGACKPGNYALGSYFSNFREAGPGGGQNPGEAGLVNTGGGGAGQSGAGAGGAGGSGVCIIKFRSAL